MASGKTVVVSRFEEPAETVLAAGQNIKSPATSPEMELVTSPFCLRWTHSGPTPSMNSAFRDMVHGFLKSRSVSHSVDLRV